MSGGITISYERLKELETLEASMNSIVETAIKEYKNATLKKLHERDKLNPAGINLRVKRYTEKHRDEINQKRREKRKADKAKLTTTGEEKEHNTVMTPIDENTIEVQRPIKIVRKQRLDAAVTNAIVNSDCPIVRKVLSLESENKHSNENQDIVVRFDT